MIGIKMGDVCRTMTGGGVYTYRAWTIRGTRSHYWICMGRFRIEHVSSARVAYEGDLLGVRWPIGLHVGVQGACTIVLNDGLHVGVLAGRVTSTGRSIGAIARIRPKTVQGEGVAGAVTWNPLNKAKIYPKN
jgi:hypothetical protein